jgi:hypothetical protein
MANDRQIITVLSPAELVALMNASGIITVRETGTSDGKPVIHASLKVVNAATGEELAGGLPFSVVMFKSPNERGFSNIAIGTIVPSAELRVTLPRDYFNFCNQRFRFMRVFPVDDGAFVVQMDLVLTNATREYVKFSFGLWGALYSQVLFELMGRGRESLIAAAEAYAQVHTDFASQIAAMTPVMDAAVAVDAPAAVEAVVANDAPAVEAAVPAAVVPEADAGEMVSETVMVADAVMVLDAEAIVAPAASPDAPVEAPVEAAITVPADMAPAAEPPAEAAEPPVEAAPPEAAPPEAVEPLAEAAVEPVELATADDTLPPDSAASADTVVAELAAEPEPLASEMTAEVAAEIAEEKVAAELSEPPPNILEPA